MKTSVAEIAAASDEQSKGIEQVNTAVSQLNTVTQQNAANSEESASAAEEMSSQSEELQAMVSTFTLSSSGNGGSGKLAHHKLKQKMIGGENNKSNAESVIPMDDMDLKGF